MAEGSDWCHFPQRLVRNAIHRHAKQAALPFEDEKYSYLVVAKNAAPANTESRVLRDPRKRHHLVELDLCTLSGRTQRQIPKSLADAYRIARKADWGDTVPEGIGLISDGSD